MQHKMLFKQAEQNYSMFCLFVCFVINKVCPLMEVATSLIWFCWAGTMGSKRGALGFCGVSTLPFMEKEKRRPPNRKWLLPL